jgi:crotonobetainyl-CoA:carnitine CoA-transferase CaiB-like acyl-CoA transferase
VQAIGGIMGTTGEADRPPVKAGPPITDFATAFLACFGILVAARAREKSGFGQKVGVNLLDTSVAMLANFVTPYLRSRQPVRPVGGGHPQMVPYQSFATRDGQWLVVACLTEQFWRNLCRALGRAELTDDARFATNAQRLLHRGELNAILDDTFVSDDASRWEQLLIEHDVPVARVNRLESVLEDPQVVHNGMITSLRHPRYGDIGIVDNPIKLSETPARPRGFPPGVGEHTDEVLAQLGLSGSQIAELRTRGVVR